MSTTPPFTVATYNCLADEYIHYMNWLNPAQRQYLSQPGGQRQNDLLTRIHTLNPDIICVQELSQKVEARFTQEMARMGYRGVYEQFNGKPDGVAIYYCAAKFSENGTGKDVLTYQDTTGRKGLFLTLRSQEGGFVVIGSTHLQGGQQHVQTANAQIQALVQKVRQCAHPLILCGDFNFTPTDPRFAMMHPVQDVLGGQNIPTSMNGTTPLRLDYIWHTGPLTLFGTQVSDSTRLILTPQEPSDHIPVMSRFAFAQSSAPSVQMPHVIHTLVTRNNMPGTDAQPSFRRKIFHAFNGYLGALNVQQPIYDQYAAKFESMLTLANDAAANNRVPFLDALVKEILWNSESPDQAMYLFSSFNSLIKDAGPLKFFNNQPFNGSPSFRFILFGQFYDAFRATFPNTCTLFYNALSSQFSDFLSEADYIKKGLGGNFIDILSALIDQKVPLGCAKTLFLSVLSPHRVLTTSQPRSIPETVITIQCHNVPYGQDLFIRGSSAGLNWNSGIKLTRIQGDTFEFRTQTPFTGQIEYKLLKGDKEWEEGVNHRIAQGQNVTMQSNFPAAKMTVVEVEFTVPPGKALYMSGAGPLGNWDRKVALTRLSANRWSIAFAGDVQPFEYKLRLDDSWEQGPNRKIDSGKKEEIKALKF